MFSEGRRKRDMPNGVAKYFRERRSVIGAAMDRGRQVDSAWQRDVDEGCAWINQTHARTWAAPIPCQPFSQLLAVSF